MFKTRICELCGIEYPIFQGGMAWVSDYYLAASVSNAGGLGIIAAGHFPPDEVRNQIRKAKELTDKPFGVNLPLIYPQIDDLIKIIIENQVKIVFTSAGNPKKYTSFLRI